MVVDEVILELPPLWRPTVTDEDHRFHHCRFDLSWDHNFATRFICIKDAHYTLNDNPARRRYLYSRFPSAYDKSNRYHGRNHVEFRRGLPIYRERRITSDKLFTII